MSTLKDKKISIIVPIYNAELYIEKCLVSICNQTYGNLQIIIVNDGSKDKSLEICSHFRDKDSRIELYSQKNLGVSAARNLGLSKVKGEYLAFVDADDYLEFNSYETAISKIEDADALFFAYSEYYAEKNFHRNIFPKKNGIVDSEEAMSQCFLPVGYFTSVWNKIFKTEVVKDILFKEEFKVSEDEIWLIEALKKTRKVMLIKDVLYNYVQNKNSSTHTDYQINYKWMSELRAKEYILQLINRSSNCHNQFEAKTYNDLFHLLWFAYITGDKKNYKLIENRISAYKKSFYGSDMYSYIRKIRYQFINFMIFLHFPKVMVHYLGELTTFKLKLTYESGANK